jgi:hypothetical protein
VVVLVSEGTEPTASFESKEQADAANPAFVRRWLDAIETATNEEKDWRKAAEEAVKAYRGERSSGQREFNIFHSNVETIVPALYNSSPTPDVRRRYGDADEVGKDVADILERALSYAVDSYDFDTVMVSSIKDMQVAGRGVVRVRYIPTVMGEGDQAQVAYQEVRCEHVPWREFRRGPASSWAKVPWISFEHYLTKEALIQLTQDPDLVEKIPLNYNSPNAKEEEQRGEKNDIFRRAKVYEIWDKEARKVRFICPDFTEGELRVEDDPLELEGFFPVPRPLQAIAAFDSLIPQTPLSVYQDLIVELNEITRRITRLVRQLRPRGLYPAASGADDIKKLTEADDGELVPISTPDLLPFAQGGSKGMESLIAWFPMEPTVKALETLFAQREATKQAIYEVSGIADIMRGASDPDETLGAQELKAAWGSLRTQWQQQEVARFVADLFTMKAELFATKFKPEMLSVMTGIQIAPEVAELLQNDRVRGYRVDIESDSTIRGDLTRNQKTMAEFLAGTAQYVSAFAPIIQIAPQALPAVVSLYSAFARQFKLGKSAEDELEKLQKMAAEPQQPQPDPAQVKAEAEAQKMKAQIEGQQKLTEVKLQGEQAKTAMKLQGEQAKLGLQMQKNQMAQQDMATQNALKREQMAAEAQFRAQQPQQAPRQ